MDTDRQGSQPVYKLSATLRGHSQDVRCVASTSASSSSSAVVLSASRDATARSWTRDSSSTSEKPQWTVDNVYAGHENFVASVASATLADGTPVVITGSNDATIMVWPLAPGHGSRPEPIKMLAGHGGAVCTLDVQGSLLASGSWDTTARIWDLNDPSAEPKLILTGAQMSVWSVKLLPGASASDPTNCQCLTGAADNIIRLYTGSKVTRTFKGHTQPVRGLCLLPERSAAGKSTFASAGNDGQIKIWSLIEGDLLYSVDGHDSFVYSLACGPDGTLFSSGEDRSVRVWHPSTRGLLQKITIPAISIWSVSILEGTDDIIVGSSDAQVRIFSRNPERQASSQELAEYDEAIASSAINANQVGDVKKSDLPDEQALIGRKGKKEGEVAMAKDPITGNVQAFQWSNAGQKWEKIGQVVDAVGSGRKQLYNGKEYDYVFDVDVAEGQPPLKLPYNVTQNPYEAAQNFLIANDLPASYVDQVVQFIEKNTGGATLGGAGGLDPYTGSSSYRSSNGQSSQPNLPSNGSSFSGDPWSSSSAAQFKPASLFPYTNYLTFAQANVAAISKKILDLNRALSERPETASEFPLDNGETTTLQAATTSYSTSSPDSFTVDTATMTVLEKLLDWPSSSRFPALDLIRVFALKADLSALVFQLLNNVSPKPSASAKENDTNAMLALRGIANMFVKGDSLMQENGAEVLETLVVLGIDKLSKNSQIALATIALNFSVLAVKSKLKSEAVVHLVDLLNLLLLMLPAEEKKSGSSGSGTQLDPEAVYRAVVAAGNVVHSPESCKGGIQLANMQKLRYNLDVLRSSKSTEQRTKDAVGEIARKLSTTSA